MDSKQRGGLSAPFALPAGLAALLIVGAVAAGTHGALSPTSVLVLAAAIVAVVSLVAEPSVTPLIGLIGWFTAVGFARAPYAQLRLTGSPALHAAAIIGVCCVAGAVIGTLMRRVAASFRLWVVDASDKGWPAGSTPPGHTELAGQDAPNQHGPAGHDRSVTADSQPVTGNGQQVTGNGQPVPGDRQGRGGEPPGGIRGRRQVAAALLAVAVLPLLTAVLLAVGGRRLSLDDDLLIYLVAVVAVAVLGGFWPAVLAAIAASLLLNWYFTPPVHTFTIEKPQNLLALLLFVTVAVTVSSIVHLAARRALQAARSGEEAASLLALAQTVLGGADTPSGVLDHLTSTLGGRAELLERTGGQWISVTASGTAPADAAVTRVEARPDLALIAAGQSRPISPRLLDGFAAQVAAAVDRERLRIQAAQAEALAEGNRMRTALLAAVSHDLRTPLASIKASVGTLRQADVECSKSDEAALLAAIEASADRLDALIGNLLDMGRLNTGSLQPFLRPTSIDEVAPAALRGLDGAASMQIMVPERLPLVRTDPGLLERVLANLFANAICHSPPGRPPAMDVHQAGDRVVLEIIDHGGGVPDEWKQRIFEPFERLDNRSAGTGVGLGLAVAKGFIEAMGASIAAADTPGGGLTMRVTLPVAGKSAASPVLVSDS